MVDSIVACITIIKADILQALGIGAVAGIGILGIWFVWNMAIYFFKGAASGGGGDSPYSRDSRSHTNLDEW